MFLVFIALAVILGIVLLIVLHASFPDSKYLNLMSEWQTLIGALVGFLTISMTFAGQRHYELAAERDLINRSDAAYLKSFRAEIEFFLDDVEQYNILSASFDETSLKDDCSGNPPYREIDSYFYDWKFKTEEKVSDIINQVSSPAYLLMMDSLKVKENFLEDLGILTAGCGDNLKWRHEHAEKTIPKYELLFREKLRDIDSMLMELR